VRKKKKKEEKRKKQDKNITSASATQGGHNDNTKANVYAAVIMAKPSESGRESTYRPLLATPSATIYYYYSTRKPILSLPSHDSRKLSQSRHYSKGVYCSSCGDKPNSPQRNLLSHLTYCSQALSPDHCDQQKDITRRELHGEYLLLTLGIMWPV